MKEYLHFSLTAVFSFSVLIFTNAYSTDTSAHRYMPLNIGNTYVYQWTRYLFSGKYRITIVRDTTINSQRFYYNDGMPDYPNMFTSNFIPARWIRVDSITGNLYGFQNPGFCLVDSLASKVGDTSITCLGRVWCQDTAMIFFAGYQFRTKELGGNLLQGIGTRYMKNIGIYGASRQELGPVYSLLGCVVNGILYGDTTFVVGIQPISNQIPSEFRVYQNYPNPFNPITKIKFAIPAVETRLIASLRIYDILGREVSTLVSEKLKPGTYEVNWDASNYPSGVYYYILAMGDFSETKKMVLIK